MASIGNNDHTKQFFPPVSFNFSDCRYMFVIFGRYYDPREPGGCDDMPEVVVCGETGSAQAGRATRFFAL